MKKQEEQTDKYVSCTHSGGLLRYITPRLHKAVDALKVKVPDMDKTTAFWTSYMKLADEHDKEFQRKYSTDLDTALIFVCLWIPFIQDSA